MLVRAASYEAVCRALTWRIPARFNMGVDVCDRHADRTPDATALIQQNPDGSTSRLRFLDIKQASNRLANVLTGLGLARADRVGILLPQGLETATSHVAAWKAGMISIPLFTLFGEDALEYRLQDSGARALITDTANFAKISAIRDRLPDLEFVLLADQDTDGDGFQSYQRALAAASDAFKSVDTGADDPALIIYTSGTTGNPKGALHAHRTLLGHLPGVEFPHDFFPEPGDLMWTPADWAWIGGLMNVLMAAWHHGVPVLAYRARKFDPGETADLIRRHEVRNVFMPPTALRLFSQSGGTFDLGGRGLRTIACAGEPMGADLLEWGREALGVSINEFYGQTECNLVVSNCGTLMPAKPGSMGVPVPGHDVAVIDAEGNVLPAGETGDFAVRAPDPVMFLGYWNNPEATREKYRGDWLIMGDTGYRDEDGYLWFVGRDDDVINSAGYRIGPGEIEACLANHPAISLAAVIGVPDPVRHEAIKAFIKLKDGFTAARRLEEDIRDFVKTRLSPHEYPRAIEFVDTLPMTATGKIKRKELKLAELAGRPGPEKDAAP